MYVCACEIACVSFREPWSCWFMTGWISGSVSQCQHCAGRRSHIRVLQHVLFTPFLSCVHLVSKGCVSKCWVISAGLSVHTAGSDASEVHITLMCFVTYIAYKYKSTDVLLLYFEYYSNGMLVSARGKCRKNLLMPCSKNYFSINN